MTRAELIHKGKLAQIGCVVCRKLFPNLSPGHVELHHFRSGGWGKGDYKTLIPLCFEHHRGSTGIHGMGTKAFDRHYGTHFGFTQADLLTEVQKETYETR